MNVQNKVKEFGISSLSGWEIAEFFKCGYMGDMNPIDHDGCYYDTRDWKEHGYANCVDFCRIADDDDALTVECGTINKPDDMTDCYRSCGWTVDPEDPTQLIVDHDGSTFSITPEVEIECSKEHWGYEPDYGPPVSARFADGTDEDHIWQHVRNWLHALGDNE